MAKRVRAVLLLSDYVLRKRSSAMETFEDESRRVMKKQRVCVTQISRQLDELLAHVETTKQQLEERQKELSRKRNRQVTRPLSSSVDNEDKSRQDVSSNAANQAFGGDKTLLKVAEPSCDAKELEMEQEEARVEEQEKETECIVKDFIDRVRQLNIEKNVAAELKAIHIMMSRFSKHIDKVTSTHNRWKEKW